MTAGERIIKEIGFQEMFFVQPTADGYAIVFKENAVDQLSALVAELIRDAQKEVAHEMD